MIDPSEIDFKQVCDCYTRWAAEVREKKQLTPDEQFLVDFVPTALDLIDELLGKIKQLEGA